MCQGDPQAPQLSSRPLFPRLLAGPGVKWARSEANNNQNRTQSDASRGVKFGKEDLGGLVATSSLAVPSAPCETQHHRRGWD